MTSVIFVHGTGGRRDAYDMTFQLIKEELSQIRPEAKLIPCLWGDPHGAKLSADGASIPDYEASEGGSETSEADEADEAVRLWKALYDNPLYEIRLLSLRELQYPGTPPGQLSPAEQLEEGIQSLPSDPKLGETLSRFGIQSVFDFACQAIRQNDAEQFEDFLKTVGEGTLDGDYEAVARAIVALCRNRCIQQGIYVRLLVSDTLRAEAVDAILDRLTKGKQSKAGISDWAINKMKGLALGFGTNAVKRKRGAIMNAGYPMAGDILVYQGQGQRIRDFIRNQIELAEPPVILLAHSLGGIACVDLLVEQDFKDKVQYLITAGSQSPFFYEIGALQTLSSGESLPDYFPKWLNIYDLRDFLSYVGDRPGLFPGRLTDVQVDNRQPFPDAHSAYWANEETWKEIDKVLP